MLNFSTLLLQDDRLKLKKITFKNDNILILVSFWFFEIIAAFQLIEVSYILSLHKIIAFDS